MDLKKICASACDIAREAGNYLKSEISGLGNAEIEQKGQHDFVTRIDRASEAFLISELEKLTPGCGFIAEESGKEDSNNGLYWIIDPLDGTTNYIHAAPLYSVSIALAENNRLLAGIIHEPNLMECFHATLGGGAFLNNEKIRVSSTKKISDSFLATGFPSRNYYRLEEYISLFRALMFDSHGIRRLGSAAVDIAWVACGRFDGFWEYHLSPWDVAAGAILVQEAGGRVSDFSGGENYIYGREILTTNGLIHDDFLQLIKTHFYGNTH